MDERIRIIAKTPRYLVVDKPSGLPTVPLKTDAPEKETLLSLVASAFPEVRECGKNPWEGGVLHRLDTPTRGLVVIARDQDSFAALSREQEAGEIVKDYLAVSSSRRAGEEVGFPPFPYGDIADGKEHDIASWFRPFGTRRTVVRPVDRESPKAWKSKTTGVWYETRVRIIDRKGETVSFACEITRGFRHQIRAHLAWAGYPLDGDASYRGTADRKFGLVAAAVSFRDPATGRPVSYRIGK